MSGIEDAIGRRATGEESYQTPLVTVVAAVEEDLDNTTATRVAGRLRTMTSRISYITGADYDLSVNSFGVELTSAVAVEDVDVAATKLRSILEDEGYTIREPLAVQAEIQTRSL